MSLNFGNKEYRNLVEQVAKNMKDIQDIQQGATVLADFGIKIVGQVDDSTDLPDPATYEGDYGDAYIVGTEEPYEYYIFTRAFEGQDEPSWFDLGEFPVPGPQGEQGEQGPVGVTPIIDMAVNGVSTLNPGQSATVSISKAGTMTNPLFKISFGIPQGAQGLKGDQGERGLQGEPGEKGEKGHKGDTGGLIEVVGIVASAELLPNPVTLDKLDAAYLVGTSSANYHLYIQIGETTASAIWTDVGLFNVGTVVTESGSPVQTFDADTKVGAVTLPSEATVKVLYAQTAEGPANPTYGTSIFNSIPERATNGQIIVPETPTFNSHAASKIYVDNSVAEVLPTQYAGDLIVGTGSHTATRLAKGSAGQVLTMNSAGTTPEWSSLSNYVTTNTMQQLSGRKIWQNGDKFVDISGLYMMALDDDLGKSVTINSSGITFEQPNESSTNWAWSDVSELKSDRRLLGINIPASGTAGSKTLATTDQIPDAVSGTNDGTNWTTITIGSTTKAIPSGGSGGGGEYPTIILIDDTATSGTLSAADLAKIVAHPDQCVIKKQGSSAQYYQMYELTEIAYTDATQTTVDSYVYELVQMTKATQLRDRNIKVMAADGTWTRTQYQRNLYDQVGVNQRIHLEIPSSSAVNWSDPDSHTSTISLSLFSNYYANTGIRAPNGINSSGVNNIARYMQELYDAGSSGSTAIVNAAPATG